MTETATIESRIAHCRERDADDYPYVVHGVAQAAGELTNGLNGPKFWPAAELRAAAPTLEGQPVYSVHEGDRREVGRILEAAYDEQHDAVVYEAGLEDGEIGEALSIGEREPTIEAGNPDGVDRHDETGAVIMRGFEYTGMATTEQGASDASYAAPGTADQNPAVAALSAADIEAALGDDAGGDDDTSSDTEEGDEAELNAYRSAGGVRFRGTRDGKLDRSAIPSDDYENHFLFDGDTKSSSSYPVVDSSGYLRRGNVAAAYSVGPRGGVSREDLYEKLRPLNDAFDTPPIEPSKLQLDMTAAAAAGDLSADPALLAAAMEDVHADDPSPADGTGEGMGVDGGDNGGEDSTDSGPTADSNSNMGTDPDPDDLEDRIDELEAKLEAKDERIAELEAQEQEQLEAELEEKEERLDDLEDEIAELRERNEDLEEQNEAARERYAAALADADTLLSEEELAEKYTLAELAEKAEEADFSTDDSGSSPVIRSGGGEGTQANLSEQEQQRKKELEAKLSDLEDTDGFLAEKERERVEAELAELTGGEA